MLGNVDADKRARDDGPASVNQARAQLGEMFKKRHLAAVFGFNTARRAGIRPRRLSREELAAPGAPGTRATAPPTRERLPSVEGDTRGHAPSRDLSRGGREYLLPGLF